MIDTFRIVLRVALFLAAITAAMVARRDHRHLPIAIALFSVFGLALITAIVGDPQDALTWALLAAIRGLVPWINAAAVWVIVTKDRASAVGMVATGAAGGMLFGALGSSLDPITQGGIYIALWMAAFVMGGVALALREPGEVTTAERAAALILGSIPADAVGLIAWRLVPKGYLVTQIADLAFLIGLITLHIHLRWSYAPTSPPALSSEWRRHGRRCGACTIESGKPTPERPSILNGS